MTISIAIYTAMYMNYFPFTVTQLSEHYRWIYSSKQGRVEMKMNAVVKNGSLHFSHSIIRKDKHMHFETYSLRNDGFYYVEVGGGQLSEEQLLFSSKSKKGDKWKYRSESFEYLGTCNIEADGKKQLAHHIKMSVSYDGDYLYKEWWFVNRIGLVKHKLSHKTIVSMYELVSHGIQTR
jgi:hypothetical protein